MFSELVLHDWRQLDSVSITFHPRLTVLTGANGSGKTTILNILSQHFGWRFRFLSQPTLDRQSALKYFSGVGPEIPVEGKRHIVGSLTYDSSHESSISVPASVSAEYQVGIDNIESVDGIYLTSHRPVYSYQPVTDIPTQVEARSQLFDQYLANLRGFWISASRVEPPSLRLKRSLISLALFGYGSEVVEPNLEARHTFDGFREVLRNVMPDHIAFQDLRVRNSEVVLVTDSGAFSLDAASGGVAALIDLSWQIFMRSELSERFVVVADEPENHLHPALQREVMPKLLAAFPQAQFIVATHNPFLVGSVRDSHVYALQFQEGRVRSELLDLADKSGSANDVLREVLGVPVPVPVWVEDELEQLLSTHDPATLDDASLRRLLDGLREIGLARQFPLAIERLTSEVADAETD